MKINKLQGLLRTKKMTIEEFVSKVGISKMGYYRIMKEANTSVKTMERISEVLEVPMSFWFEVGTPSNQEKEEEYINKYKKDIEKLTEENQKLWKQIMEKDIQIRSLTAQIQFLNKFIEKHNLINTESKNMTKGKEK